jgi:hypothetical protein
MSKSNYGGLRPRPLRPKASVEPFHGLIPGVEAVVCHGPLNHRHPHNIFSAVMP